MICLSVYNVPAGIFVLLFLLLVGVILLAVSNIRLRDARKSLALQLPLPENSLGVQLQPVDYMTILADIDMGVLAFNWSGNLVYINQTARSMLGDPCASCENLDAFLTLFGSDNGLKAGVILGKKSLSGIYVRNGHSILLDLQQLNRMDKQHFTTVTTLDITQRENLERQRKQFVSNVSHELKTPLTTILTYAESLQDWGLAELSEKEIRRDVQRIYDEGKRMQSLVNDLSLLSSLDGQGIRPRMEEMNLDLLLRYCVDRLQFPATSKEINLEVQIAPDLPLIFGERSSLERVLNNLIENAIKYTERGGQISLHLNYIRDEVYLKVRDTGIGIQPDDLPLIFNRFFRVDNSGSSVLGGTGLGLAIAKELIEMHEGRISVTSTYGKGTEFIVFLPSAERVMRETLESARGQSSRHSVLLEAASEVLLEQAQEQDAQISLLSDLSEEQSQSLLALYQREDLSSWAGSEQEKG